MFERKPISHDSVPGALAKVERYRLLNEPGEAESICRDILDIEPDNQGALIALVLTLTDQIPHDAHCFKEALATAARLHAAYDRAYYAGIAWERRAKSRHHNTSHSARHDVYDWIVKALHLFEEAEHLRAPGNDEAVLRWNACVRFLAHHKDVTPREAEEVESILSE
jgi:hypothetical protein